MTNGQKAQKFANKMQTFLKFCIWQQERNYFEKKNKLRLTKTRAYLNAKKNC